MIIFFIFHKVKKTPKNKDIVKQVEPCEKLPWKGNLLATYLSLEKFEAISSIQIRKLINAYLVKWMLESQIEVIWQPEIVVGIRTDVVIQLNEAKEGMDKIEQDLFDIFWAACHKSSSFLLNTNDFRKWCFGHYPELRGWNRRAKEEGYFFMQEIQAVPIEQSDRALSYRNYVSKYTEVGKLYRQEMFGFSSYLENFSTIGLVKKSDEWKKDLIFSVILGVSQEFIHQAESLDSQFFEDFLQETNYWDMGFSMQKIVDDLWEFGFLAEQAYNEAEMWEQNHNYAYWD